MVITLVILALSALFFMSGKVRSDLVAVCTLLALLVFQILTPEEGLAGFSNSVVVMMVGLFVVGGGIFQTGLAKMISGKILKLAGRSELKLFLLVMLATAGIGAFVSNTGTVALMLPIVVSMAAGAGMNAGRLLMPLAFASSMGGMMTLIGTPPNLIIQDTLLQAGYGELGFFSFLPVGLVCVTVGTLVLLPLTKWFLSKRGGVEGEGARREVAVAVGEGVRAVVEPVPGERGGGVAGSGAVHRVAGREAEVRAECPGGEAEECRAAPFPAYGEAVFDAGHGAGGGGCGVCLRIAGAGRAVGA